MRTLKEQEYQEIALKYRSITAFYEMLIEAIIGVAVVYALLLWHWVPAALVGAAFGVGVIQHFVKWQLRATAYVIFKQELEAMKFHGRTMAFVDKIEASIADGEKELARMEAKAKDEINS